MLKPEASLDAQVALSYRVIAWRCDLDDLVVLNMQGKCTSNAAIWADGVGLRLFFFFPGTGFAHIVLTCKHESTSGADLNAVAAVDARRVGEINIEFGRDADVEASARNSNGECVLPLLAACVNALVTHDAL